LYRKALQLLPVLGLAAAIGVQTVGCGTQEQEAGPRLLVEGDHPIAALSFAGVDLQYALRRIAGEADLPFVIDEVKQKGSISEDIQDLRLERIDIDLPAGQLKDSLRMLYEHVPVFDYQVKDDLMLVRSNRALSEYTALDVKDIPAAEIEVDMYGLVRWMTQIRPRTLLRDGNILGQPVRKKATLKISENSSALDVFALFAREIDWGILIRRAGYVVDRDAEKLTVAASTVELIHALKKPQPLTPWRDKNAAIYALASIADRTGANICVIDRAMLGDGRGDLNFRRRSDPDLGALESVQLLSEIGMEPAFSFEEDEHGVLRVHSRAFTWYPTGREILESPVKGGTFEGTLAQLGRWINANHRGKHHKVLMSGEVTPDAPSVKLEIAEGTLVSDVLYEFARKAGEGWTLVIRDQKYPSKDKESMPVGSWTGGYLRRLQDWGPKGGRTMT
jgi:hypothetical protein